MSKPLLDLGSLNPERPFITIDNKQYRYKVQMDMTLMTLAALGEIDRRLAPKASKSDPTPADTAEFSAAIDEGVRHVMFDPIPDEVLAQLNEVAKLSILEAFPTATARAGSPLNRKARRAMSRSTSRVLSRASSGSTPARRGKAGSPPPSHS
jgi:hypothetical protein